MGKNTVKIAYTYEIENNKNSEPYKNKIGLMYVSDYGYAASPENWNTTLDNYNNDANRNNNWLYSGMIEWLLTPTPPDLAFRIESVGSIGVDYTYEYYYAETFAYLETRPTFYLKSDVTYVSGTGTESDPYRIA